MHFQIDSASAYRDDNVSGIDTIWNAPIPVDGWPPRQ